MKFLGKALCVTYVCALASCGSVPQGSTGPLVVQIAEVGPLSGRQASYGTDARNGAQLAIDELNGSGVIVGGRKATFVLVAEDDRGNADRARDVASDLVMRSIAGVVGHLNAMPSLEAYPVYERAGIPVISPSVTHPGLTASGMKVAFRLQPNDERVAYVTAEYVIKQNPGARFAVIDDRQAYGSRAATQFEGALRAAGQSAVVRASVADDVVNFSQEVERLKQSRVDVLFFAALDDQVGPMVRQLFEAGLKVKVVSADNACTSQAVKLSSYAPLDGNLLCGEPTGFPADRANRLAQFKDKLKEMHPAELPVFSPYAYDAVMLLANAMVKAGSADPLKYLPVLAATKNYLGLTGDVSFDDRGNNALAPISIFTYRGRTKTRLELVN